jgi:hypothetical protein
MLWEKILKFQNQKWPFGHHNYVGGGIHLNQFEYRKEKKLHPLDMKSLVCLSFSLALFSTKKCSGWKPCGLLHSVALVNLHRQQSNGLYAIFGDEV